MFDSHRISPEPENSGETATPSWAAELFSSVRFPKLSAGLLAAAVLLNGARDAHAKDPSASIQPPAAATQRNEVSAVDPGQAEITILGNKKLSGVLTKYDGTQFILVEADGTERSIAAKQVTGITFNAALEAAPQTVQQPEISMVLFDGSVIACQAFAFDGQQMRIKEPCAGELTLKRNMASSVVLVPPVSADELAAFSKLQSGGDQLLVRKGEVMDSLEGTVTEITAETIKFDPGDGVINVSRAKRKVAAINFFGTVPDIKIEPKAELQLVDGSALKLTSFALADGKFNVETCLGLQLELPIEAAKTLDLSAGKVQFLADMQPKFRWFPARVEEGQEIPLSAFTVSRKWLGLVPHEVTLGTEKYEKGLTLAGRTELTYQIPGGFKRFNAVAGFEEVHGDNEAELVISGEMKKPDGKDFYSKELYKKRITVHDIEKINLDITGVRSLRIVVDFGEHVGLGDRLDIGAMHITK